MADTSKATDAAGRLAEADYAGVDWRPLSEMPRKDYGDWFDFRTGMLLKEADGEVWLVGDTNEQGGSCGCCQAVDKKIEGTSLIAWAWAPGWEPA